MSPAADRPTDPRTLRKFALQFGALLLCASGLLVWRGTMAGRTFAIVAGSVAAFALLGWLRPAVIGPLYHVSRQLSRWSEKYLGGAALTLLFFLFITPLGWVMRRFGYDPLALRPPPSPPSSYWRPAAPPGPLDRMY